MVPPLRHSRIREVLRKQWSGSSICTRYSTFNLSATNMGHWLLAVCNICNMYSGFAIFGYTISVRGSHCRTFHCTDYIQFAVCLCMYVSMYECMYVCIACRHKKITSCSHGNSVASYRVIMQARPIDTTIMCLTSTQSSFETSIYNLIIHLVW